MTKNRKRIGFFNGTDDDSNADSSQKKQNSFVDPRVEAFAASFAYEENIAEADEFFLISKLRLMFNCYPFKDKDPIDMLLLQLKNEGFHLKVDAMDKMGIPVRRIGLIQLPLKCLE